LPDVLFFEDDRPAALAARLMDLLKAGPLPPSIRFDLPTWSNCVDGLLSDLGIFSGAVADAQKYQEAGAIPA